METINLTRLGRESQDFVHRVEAESKQNVRSCYQCGKCTGGCPVAFAMDVPPRQIMRMLQLGMQDEVLKSSTIWLCASCTTCTTRCPREIDLARVMDVLRGIAREKGSIGVPEVAVFNDTFLRSVKNNGRLHEVGLIAYYNMRSKHFFHDVLKAPVLFFKGKLKILPGRIKKVQEVRSIFEHTVQAGRERM